VLVVVPAIVLGALLWNQLTSEHRRQRAAIPSDARDAARRLQEAIQRTVGELLEREGRREFYHYQQDYYDLSTVDDGRGGLDPRPASSPLVTEQRPTGILGWFSWDWYAGGDIEPVILTGAEPPQRSPEAFAQRAQWRLAFEEFVRGELLLDQRPLGHVREALDLLELESGPEEQVAVDLLALNMSPQRDPECVVQNLEKLHESVGDLQTLGVRYGDFGLRALRDGSGALRLVARRKVGIEELPRDILAPRCYEALERETVLVQGFEIDLAWLLEELPSAQARAVLARAVACHLPGAPIPDDAETTVVPLDLFELLDVEVLDPADEEMAVMHVSASTASIDRAHQVQLGWLLGVTAVMVASIGIGIRLLVSSARVSLEQARRTENFVAAVTHELRTPLAAVKMYGEMLRDGWARDEGRRQDYLERIVGETNRLDELVDKVLTKRMLTGHAPDPTPGDLSALVADCASGLRRVGGKDLGDLEVDLTQGLPSVWVRPEGLRQILVNLVENARKYAPVPSGGEPIRISTRRGQRGGVLLEVADRGPGIPEQERSKIFEAFYHMGDETRRSTLGTGLGLHLVELQARSMRARVRVMTRSGGGAVFRVSLRVAR